MGDPLKVVAAHSFPAMVSAFVGTDSQGETVTHVKMLDDRPRDLCLPPVRLSASLLLAIKDPRELLLQVLASVTVVCH